MSDKGRKAKDLIRRARRRFTAMVVTYSLGVFNDNFFKQAACLIAISIAHKEYQGYATVVFTLPFLLFAAPAGWLADRFAKRNVIIGAKALEVVAMAVGAVGIFTLSWPLIFLMLFLMALQSTLFSPALNGSIPELFPTHFVQTANARLRVAVTGAILAGMALAGFLLDRVGPWSAFPTVVGSQFGRMLCAITVACVALLGVAVSLACPYFPPADPKARFPRGGPISTVKKFLSLRSDKLLFTCIIGDCIFWFIASLQVLIINDLGSSQLGLSKSLTSGLVVSQLVGLALGGLVAAKMDRGERWYTVLVPGALGMACGMILMAALPLYPASIAFYVAAVLLAVIGMAGGIFIIPLESFIQIRPPATEKGTVWSVNNFSSFTGIALSGPVFVLLATHLGLRASSVFGLLTILALGVAAWLRAVLPKAA